MGNLPLGVGLTADMLKQFFNAAHVSANLHDKDREGDYKQLMYLLPASAGLSGGIFRLPNSFVTPIVGGRNVVFFTSVLLAIPCIWMALALSDGGTSYLQVIIAAGFDAAEGDPLGGACAPRPRPPHPVPQAPPCPPYPIAAWPRYGDHLRWGCRFG